MTDEKNLQNVAVAKMDLKKLSTAELIDLAAAKKVKADFTKAEYDVVAAEIQNRAITYQEDRHIKFTEWNGTGRAVASVAVAQKFDILNFYKMRELLGPRLVDDKVKMKPAEIKYEVDKQFQRALTAVILNDYERKTTIEEVLDKAGWFAGQPEKKVAVLKKLKGDYKNDKKAILSTLNMQENETNIDAELYVIYQIVNWRLILAYFDEATFEETAEAIKRCVVVDETAKIGLRVG